MWFKKKRDSFGFTQEQRKLIDEVAQEAAQTEPCTTCGCIVQKTKGSIMKYASSFGLLKMFYCNRCKPPYDETTFYEGEMRCYRRIPEHLIEVTEEGKEIKNVVQKEKG